MRRDEVTYYPSRNLLDDLPATLSQDRSLLNYGIHTDLSHVRGRHNFKVGVDLKQTHLDEEFRLGVTDRTYNDPARPDYLPSLARFDLTRGGKLFEFTGKATVTQAAYFGQDSITLGGLTMNLGLRVEHYNGLTRGDGIQPRAGLSYLFKQTGTLIRAGYSHMMETPVNENLVASSSTGPGGLASNLLQGTTARQQPIALGRRNQYDAGIQQTVGKLLLVDVSYFRKYTRNAYDFDALFSTPVSFPISWKQSKLDGVAARISTTDFRGMRIYATMGHANARFFGPENGGIIFNSDLNVGAYRQDHDQVYQQNANLYYQRPGSRWWTSFNWRYDSGLVVGAVNGVRDALDLTAAQQSAIGFYCGAERAGLSHRITTCASTAFGADRIHILGDGVENDDHNPPRAKGRHVFHASVGTDNFFQRERVRTTLRFTVTNLSNKAALYNFLSPFSGTHWVAPRSFEVRLGVLFP